MDSTKNFFDAWVNTQTQLVDNLMDTSKKLQASFDSGETDLQKSAEVYQDWLERQQKILNDLLASLKTQFNQEQAPEFFKEWLQAQINFGKHWLDMSNNAMNTQDNSQFKKMQENWNSLYNEWSSQFGKPLDSLRYTPGTITQDSLRSLLDNTRVYLQMFELWQPILRMMQNNPSFANNFNMMSGMNMGGMNMGNMNMGGMPQMDMFYKLFNLEKYKGILDSILPTMTPFNPEAIREQLRKYADMLGGGMDSIKNLISQPFQMSMTSMLPTNHPQFEMLNGVNEQMLERLSQLALPYITMIPASREKEMLILNNAIYEKYVRYYVKGVEMQTLVYTAGFQSVEKAMREIAAKASENAQMMSFDEFYNNWLNSIEQDFIALFASETYSVLQGGLLKLQMDMKIDTDKLMELMLAPLPVVPRSELDEVNATVHELRRKVRNLEKQMKAQQQEGTTEKKKITTTPASRKPKATKTKEEEASTVVENVETPSEN